MQLLKGGFSETGFGGREQLSSATAADSQVPLTPALPLIKNQVRSHAGDAILISQPFLLLALAPSWG